MSATPFPWDAERPWCACCLEFRVEFPGQYFCAVCDPRPVKPMPPLPAPRQPWMDAAPWADVTNGGAV